MKQLRIIGAVALIVLMAGPASAQAQSAGQDSGAAPTITLLSAAALQDLVAPVALYPDALIAQLLPASAYPLEVVQAARWLDQNKNLQSSAPDQFKASLEQQDWDPSVKAMVGFPSVLSLMNDKLDWTSRLGDAFVNQQKDVMSAIQVMRAKAQSAGSLKSTPQQKVVVQDRIIEVQPADPQVIYVPSYNPQVVYVAPPPDVYSGADMFAASALSFGAGVAVGAAFWGGGCNWGGGYVYNNININNFNRNGHWINPNRYGPHNLYNPHNNRPWRPDQNRRQADSGQAWRGGAAGGRQVASSSQVASELESRGWGGGDGAHGGSFSKSGRGFEGQGLDRGTGLGRGGAFDNPNRGQRDLDFGSRGRASREGGGRGDFEPSHSSFHGFHGGGGFRGFGGGGFRGGGGFHGGGRR